MLAGEVEITLGSFHKARCFFHIFQDLMHKLLKTAAKNLTCFVILNSDCHQIIEDSMIAAAVGQDDIIHRNLSPGRQQPRPRLRKHRSRVAQKHAAWVQRCKGFILMGLESLIRNLLLKQFLVQFFHKHGCIHMPGGCAKKPDHSIQVQRNNKKLGVLKMALQACSSFFGKGTPCFNALPHF